MDELIVQSGGDDYDTIVERCAQATASASVLDLTNPFQYYRAAIDAFCSLSETVIVPVAELGNANSSKTRLMALRHDIDADMATAIACAKYLQEAHIPGAFFVLHTSHYYGSFSNTGEKKYFTRHDGFGKLLDQMLATDQEVAIHNDALGVCFDHGVDGVAAFTAELNWLRDHGATITGSAAHNSPAVYGAECFEIFKGLAVADRRTLHWRNRSIRLQTLSMPQLGLEYEANHPVLRPQLDPAAVANLSKGSGDLLRQHEWQRQYFLNHPIFQRGYDYDAWLIGNDSWLLAGDSKVLYPLTLGKLVNEIEAMPNTARIMVSVHPVYVGKAD